MKIKILKVPSTLKPLSWLLKYFIRKIVYWRLDLFPLKIKQAEKWAETFKKWPGIYNSAPYLRRIEIFPKTFVDVGLIDVIQRTLVVEGVWDSAIVKALKYCLKPGDTFIDIGANIGYFTLLGSQLVGNEGKVFALEPSRRALQKLVPHLYQNECSNVFLFSFGAGSVNELKTLNLATPNNIGASSFCELSSPVGRECVPVLRLDDILPDLDVVPDVIKIDTEGFELAVLKGMQKILNESKPIVLCEITDAFLMKLGYRASDVITFMEDIGYKAYIIEDENHLSAFQISTEHFTLKTNQAEILFAIYEKHKSFLDKIIAPTGL